MKPTFELSHILSEYGDDFVQKYQPLIYHQKVLDAIKNCRTAKMGGHLDRCDSCHHERISYNSCRNRHCPKCQTTNRERWILARKNDLLNCTYFHVVFTIPQELNTYCLRQPKEIYNILFQASKDTLMLFGNDPKHLGAQMGMIALLHTWGQNLSLHPHIHCIVPGGGFTKNGDWKDCKSNGQFLFPVKAMSQVFRGKFMEKFRQFLEQNKTPLPVQLRRILYDQNWVLYAKEPFLGPEQVIEYLGRYSHKIAISNHRILEVNNANITFKYRDYAHGNTTKSMTLSSGEFLRRFCLHILPLKFVKIRHYGFLASRVKHKLQNSDIKLKPKQISIEKPDYKEITLLHFGFDVDQCPCCKTGRMRTILQFGANAPPKIKGKRIKIQPIKTNM